MAKKKPQYFQFEPGAFLSDVDFQQFSAAERGLYCTVIFYLYKNNGRMNDDPVAISRLCNSTTETWKKVKKKFISRNGSVQHKRVSKEIKKAKRFIQACSDAGIRGSKKRWGGHSDPNREAIAKKTKRKGKESKVNISNSNRDFDKDLSVSSSDSFRLTSQKFHLKVTDLLKPRTSSDRTCIKNVAEYLTYQADKESSDYLFKLAYDFAVQSKREAKNPMAMFMAMAKSELGYKKSINNALKSYQDNAMNPYSDNPDSLASMSGAGEK